MKKIVLSLVSVMALSGTAFAADTQKSTLDVLADSGLYVGAGYGYYDQSSDIAGADATVHTIMFDLGYAAHKYLDLETRYWLGVTDPDTDKGSVSGDQWSWGAYLKPKYPVANVAEVYALLGYAQNSVSFSNGAGDHFTDGFSWGVGASYVLNKNISFSADYVSMAMQSSTSIDGYSQNADTNIYTLNVGVNYKF